MSFNSLFEKILQHQITAGIGEIVDAEGWRPVNCDSGTCQKRPKTFICYVRFVNGGMQRKGPAYSEKNGRYYHNFCKQK